MIARHLFTTISAAALCAGGALAEGQIIVTSTGDAGPGTLRAALEQAAASAANQILFVAEGDIALASPLTYDGIDAVSIFGAGNTVTLDQNATVFSVTQGASVSIADLNFSGPGGFDIENRGDTDGETAGKGIFVDVRDDQTGFVALSLRNVTVSDVAGHGVHVSDCTLADNCGGGEGGAGNGSDASIAVQLDGVTIRDVGHGRYDADGLRVDERGIGDIVLVSVGSVFVGVGADGVELDEGQAGSVIVNDHQGRYEDNGSYCDPDILGPLLPAEPEAEFDDGEMAEADIPGPVTNAPDTRCIEREVSLHASGSVEEYEFSIDLDDGLDLDEAGPGDIVVTMVGSVVTGNLDQGVDNDEEGDGDIVITLIGAEASSNRDDGFKSSEEDGGSILAVLVGAVARDNGGKGIVFQEENDGDLTATVHRSTTANNDDGDDTGIEAEQEDSGTGVLRIIGSDIADGIDVDGVSVKQ